jgi:hypothetical protein
MGKIEEEWEPFEIQVNIEGQLRPLLVVPDREEPKYEVFDEHTSLGVMWREIADAGEIWCGEGVVVKALLATMGEQIEDYLANKPE